MFNNQVDARSTVKNFVLVQTGTYQEQHLRPFNINVTSQNVNDLVEVTRGGMNIGVSAVQEIASNIVAPSANTEGMTGIEEGWNSRRFRFLMTVEESHPFIQGTTTQRIFFGYTDHCDASYNHLDPAMRIYFNSETVISNHIENTPAGPVMRSRLLGANQIVSPVDVTRGPVSIYQSPTTHLVRPEDLFSLGQTNAVADKLKSSGAFTGNIHHSIDNRTLTGMGNDYKYNRRQDSSPVRYLTETLNAYQHAIKESSNEFDDGPLSVGMDVLLGEASSHSKNQRLSSNVFLTQLRDHCGYMEKGFVTLSELQSLFPETAHDSVTKFGLDNGQSIRKISNVNDSEVWTGADNQSVAASLIAQTIPSVMMDTLFRSISFSVTNGSGPNNYIIDINPMMTKTIVNISADMIQSYIVEFERRLKTDVLNLISRGNQIPFKLIVSSDLAGDSIIDVAIGNEGLTRYVAPTFGDALFAPVITRDISLVNSISNDMIWLVSQVIDPNKHSSSAMQSFTPYEHPQTQVVNTNFNQQGNDYVDLGLI